MEFIGTVISNLIILVIIPFLFYFSYHQIRNWWLRRRSDEESAGKIVRISQIFKRLGLQLGDTRYLSVSLVFALVSVVIIFFFPPSAEHSTREGSSVFESFDGLGWSLTSILMALAYGVIKTGFCEEFLFRGLITGALERRMSIFWANLVQAVIFFLPHLLILVFAPELWPLLPVVFALALVLGYIRIKSGSILGPWIIHAAGNVATAISVAVRSVGS